ncbi:MAG TPA: alkaline phosphatase D family protein [Nevskiaceae bacterium]|nr:alkaline phosphatase D family protein [Nevskiaceae bacterium]
MRLRRRPGLTRRHFLRAGLAAGSLPWLAACGESGAPVSSREPAASTAFRHGVASGDPLADRVLLWTRVTPAAGQAALPVRLSVYADPGLETLIDQRETEARAERDYTVKIDLDGLQPGQTVYYRFEAEGAQSPVGRARTLPAAGVERLRFGVVACSQYTNGYFNAYAALAQRADLEAILHLGDYLYEAEYVPVVAERAHTPPREITTLADYRERHAQYKTDPDLQALHRQHPMIAIWDDHESTDNSYRDSARNHTEGPPPEGEGRWLQRKAWAQQAYFEWMPIREQAPGDVDRIYRRFAYGDLAELVMLDTRLQRDVAPADFPAPCEPSLSDPARQMLGATQEAWFAETLRASTARWRVVGSSVMFGQWKVAGAPNAACGGQYLNADQWDGYQAARDRVFALLSGADGGAPVRNSVFLAGDIHSAWALDLTEDPNNPATYDPVSGRGVRAVEFVCNSVTSDFPTPGDSGAAFLSANPAIRYIQTASRGYLLLDIDREQVTGEFWLTPDVSRRSAEERFARGYSSRHEAQSLSLVTAPREPAPAPPLAP